MAIRRKDTYKSFSILKVTVGIYNFEFKAEWYIILPA